MVILCLFVYILFNQSFQETIGGKAYSPCKFHREKLYFQQVTVVNCSYLGLTNIPATFFPNLTHMDLSHNKLRSVSKLKIYPNLRFLSLAHNELTIFPGPYLTTCKLLRELDVTGNHFDAIHLPSKSMNLLSSILGLDAQQLPREFSSSFPNLHHLDVTWHSAEVSGDPFEKLHYLNSLKLNFTTARSISHSLLRFAKSSLYEIAIAGANLEIIPRNLFHGLYGLQYITINAPNFHAISAELFQNLTKSPIGEREKSGNLAEIYISGVHKLPQKLFYGQTNLKKLCLNNIKYLPGDLFSGLLTLNELNLSQCTIVNLPAGWFRNLPNLRTLNLSKTGLFKLTDGIFDGLQSLTDLDLSYNYLREDKMSVAAFNSFRMVLEKLNLSGNYFSSLSTGLFSDMIALKFLDISNNKLEHIESAQVFRDLQQLLSLSMRDNKLSTLPTKLLQQQSHLMHLDLQTNILASLPSDLLMYTTSLLRLDLANNRIVFLPIDFFSQFPLIEEVILDGNPYHCNCSLWNMMKALPLAAIHGVCTTPIDFAGKEISKILLKEKCEFKETSKKSSILLQKEKTAKFSLVLNAATSISRSIAVHAHINTDKDVAPTTWKPASLNVSLIYTSSLNQGDYNQMTAFTHTPSPISKNPKTDFPHMLRSVIAGDSALDTSGKEELHMKSTPTSFNMPDNLQTIFKYTASKDLAAASYSPETLRDYMLSWYSSAQYFQTLDSDIAPSQKFDAGLMVSTSKFLTWPWSVGDLHDEYHAFLPTSTMQYITLGSESWTDNVYFHKSVSTPLVPLLMTISETDDESSRDIFKETTKKGTSLNNTTVLQAVSGVLGFIFTGCLALLLFKYRRHTYRGEIYQVSN